MAVADKREHQLDAERAVLGALLIDREIIRDLLAAVDEKDFLNSANRLVFQTARSLFRAGGAVDAVTIRDRIGEQYTDFLVQLMEITPTSSNWREYARLMHEQAALQRTRTLADKLSQAVTLEECRPLCGELGNILSGGRRLDTWTTRELLDSFFESQDPDAPAAEYISCGLSAVDEGSYIEPGDVVVLGGYPSDGKTALALQMAWHMAKQYRVGFFSLETARRKLRDRLIAHAGQIDFTDIKRRTVSEADWKALADNSAGYASRSLTLVEAAGMTAFDIQTTAQAYGFQVVFIDYIQLVAPEGGSRGGTRSEQMASVSRALHTFAQKTGTLVVELAQLVRPDKGTDRSGREKWREPAMHDLKESGQFEQDADVIFLLYRPSPSDEKWAQDRHRFLKIAKNKEGRWGKWPLFFDGPKQTFSVAVDESRVLRNLVDAGRRAKARSHAERDIGQVEITELPGGDQGLPF